MDIKIKKLHKNAMVPSSGTIDSAGYDLYSCFDDGQEITLDFMETKFIPTGISIEIPRGFFGMVCPRSGLSIKNGITILNAPGIVDSDYRGELKCILTNTSKMPFKIENNMRIAQILIIKHESIRWIETNDELSKTDRGMGGFGSTGL